MTAELVAAALELLAGLMRRGATVEDARVELRAMVDGWPSAITAADVDIAVRAGLGHHRPG